MNLGNYGDYFLIAGLLIIVWALFRLQTKRKFKAKENLGVFDSTDDVSHIGSKIREKKELEGAMQKLLIELHDTSRELVAAMETRARKLDFLVQEADKKISELQKLLDSLKEKGIEIKNQAGDSRFFDIYDLADSGLDVIEIAKRTGRMPGEIELILSLRENRC